MPAASGGKRSVKGLSSKMVGSSATQKVRAAEWSGELAWVDSHHPSSSGRGASWQGGGGYTGGGEPDYDYSAPWYEKRGGEWFCLLCGSFATEGHVASDKHKQRESSPQWYLPGVQAGGHAAQAGAADSKFDRPWYEEREGFLYCLLCSAWAVEGHLASEKHRNREANPQYYGFSGSAPAARAAAPEAPAPATYTAPTTYTAAAAPTCNARQPPWLKTIDGEQYCELCGSWATEGHLASDRHRKRAAAPEWYGFNAEAATPQPAVAAAPPPPPPATINGWQRFWSDAHQRAYYYSAEAGITQWEPPPGFQETETTPPAMPEAASARAAAEAAVPAAARAAAEAAEAAPPQQWQHPRSNPAAAAAAPPQRQQQQLPQQQHYQQQQHQHQQQQQLLLPQQLRQQQQEDTYHRGDQEDTYHRGDQEDTYHRGDQEAAYNTYNNYYCNGNQDTAPAPPYPWRTYYTPVDGINTPYFYNTDTRETTWEVPDGSTGNEMPTTGVEEC